MTSFILSSLILDYFFPIFLLFLVKSHGKKFFLRFNNIDGALAVCETLHRTKNGMF